MPTALPTQVRLFEMQATGWNREYKYSNVKDVYPILLFPSKMYMTAIAAWISSLAFIFNGTSNHNEYKGISVEIKENCLCLGCR